MIAICQQAGTHAALARLEQHVAPAARLLGLLANQQRLILLCRLSQGECSVTELAALAGLSQSACSQHLARLRDESVVEPRRVARTVYYRIVDPSTVKIIGLLCELYGKPSGEK